MNLIFRQGTVIDPSQELHAVVDLGIDDGRVAEIAPRIRKKARKEIDARGLILAPGFIDMHVHLREPGREDSETIETGTNAAARGAELMRRLRDLQRRLPAIGEVRGLGLMVGVELVNKDGSANKDLQKKVRQVCLDSGMVVLSCGPHDNVLRLVPPLNLSQAELDEGWEILNAAFQEVAA